MARKPKILAEPVKRTPEEHAMVEKAFYAGWDYGWNACKKELERDVFIIRMQERQRLYDMFKEANKEKVEE